MTQQALGQQHLSGSEDTPPAAVGGQRAAGQRREPAAVGQPEQGREAAVELPPGPWGDTKERSYRQQEELHTAERRSYATEGRSYTTEGRSYRQQRGGATDSRGVELHHRAGATPLRGGATDSRGEELHQ